MESCGAPPGRSRRSFPPTRRSSAPSAAGRDNDTTVVCAAGGLPGELHKLWRPARAGGYHVEYGFSCMGYEIAGGLGVKLADPEREVVVMVGDGSYLMLNSEIATSVMLGLKLVIVVLDNRGFGCINRLQKATGGAPFNNLLADSRPEGPDAGRLRGPCRRARRARARRCRTSAPCPRLWSAHARRRAHT